jgi:hypothetical protein
MLKHRYKNVVLTAHGQAMADGKWGGRCLVSVHKGNETEEQVLTTPLVYATEQEASEAGLAIGKGWLERVYSND